MSAADPASGGAPSPIQSGVSSSAVTQRLSGDDAVRSYLGQLTRTLRGARLNAWYPDARRLVAHLEAMGPDVHAGLYTELEIDPRSGLPTYREWTRVKADQQLAPEVLEDLGSEARVAARARARPDSIYGKQLLKHRYYSALRGRRLAPLGDMEVALRRIEPERRVAHFHVVLDKLDASGLFVRYSIDLCQTSSAWSRPLVVLEDDDARHTEAFRTLVYRFTSLDAELTYSKLVTLADVEVERVVKGSVGPFISEPASAPTALAPVLEAAAAEGHRPMIGLFGLDMVAGDLAAHRDNDPFDDLLGAHLSDEARAGYDAVRGRYGYKVFKDRKLVAPVEAHDGLRDVCAAAGTRNIIYRPGR